MNILSNLAEYHEYRLRLVSRMDALGRGARHRASLDLRTHATLISSALNGVLYKPDLLEQIEGWLTTQEADRDRR